MLRSKRVIYKALVFFVIGIIAYFWFSKKDIWNFLDYKITDAFFGLASDFNLRENNSQKILYILINDKTYKDFFKKNYLDRKIFADVIKKISKYSPAETGIDIIFAYPSSAADDKYFAKSLAQVKNIHLPYAFSLIPDQKEDHWFAQSDSLRDKPFVSGKEYSNGTNNNLTQLSIFSDAAKLGGHINIISDYDGIFRRIPLILLVEEKYYPSLALSMFLHYYDIKFRDIYVNWGKNIIIEAEDNNWLNKDITIPINEKGETVIPYTQKWGKDFERISFQKFIEISNTTDKEWQLKQLIEGKFVFIADVSNGVSDLGDTPIGNSAPLIIVHSALLNGLINNTFYWNWTNDKIIILCLSIGLLLLLASLFYKQAPFYILNIFIIIGIIIFSWIQFINYTLVPAASIIITDLVFFFSLIMVEQLTVHKEKQFIQTAFSRYVSPKFVTKLLKQPELLKLGGEEKVLTVLFSDIKDFTTFSEKMPPKKLVNFLNQYLTEMSDIIIKEGGTIDKYQGDSIMAMFGAPVYFEKHADAAVRSSLKMLKRLNELKDVWVKNSLPEVSNRIGLNTGNMIVGNIGSRQVFDYTVMGDSVNLASRLEGANKFYNTQLMISEDTYNSLTKELFKIRLLDIIKVQGKSMSIKVYEVYGFREDTVANEDYYKLYNEAFELFLNHNYESALDKFTGALNILPEDKTAKKMITWIERISKNASLQYMQIITK